MLKSETSILWLFIAIGVSFSIATAARRCTMEELNQAENEGASLKNWKEVHRSFKKFSHCDSGGVGEGYSESIARLLADNWSSVDQLNRLVAHDKHFERFVLRHVDELMTPEQSQKILNNAEAHCPREARRLCKAIAAKVKE